MLITQLKKWQKCQLILIVPLSLIACTAQQQFTGPEDSGQTTSLSQIPVVENISCNLIWEDNFTTPELDTDKWQHETGDGCDKNLCGWGNNEQQWYQPENTEIKDGILHIRARREDGYEKTLTSSKITTEGLFSQKFGRFEARIRTPGQRGLWPAFWMMPQSSQHPWPIDGEIDIMEQSGTSDLDLRQIGGAAHYGELWPKNTFYGDKITSTQPWGNDFHIYRVDWIEDSITWSVDGEVYAKLHKRDLKKHKWPFNQKEFYLILNLAIGGNLGGVIQGEFSEAILKIDYVRVYNDCKTT